MQRNSLVILKVLLNTFHLDSPTTILKSLPEEDFKEIEKIETTSKKPLMALLWRQQAIFHTHYSWFLPIIKDISPAIQPSLIASLSPHQSSGLRKLLKTPEFKGSLPASLKNLLLSQLYTLWNPLETLPPDYLPPSPLKELTLKSKPELLKIIDLLSMFDLADNIKNIVDKKKLELIYFCLTQEQQQFLRNALRKHEKFELKTLELEKWDGDTQKLIRLLHQRGLQRFGVALSSHGPHILWYIVQALDVGRANTLSKEASIKLKPNMNALLQNQVLSVINFLNLTRTL